MDLVELLARLENIADLSEIELAEIEVGLDEAVQSITESDTTAETVADLQHIADAKDTIRDERTAREEAAAELEAEAMAALQRIRGKQAEEDEEDDGDLADVDGEVVDTEGDAPVEGTEGEAPVAETAEAEAVAASAQHRAKAKGTPMAQIKANQPRSSRTLSIRSRESKVRLTAAPDLREFSAGQDFPDWDAVAEATTDVLQHTAGGAGFRRIGRLDWRNEYPDDRTFIHGQDGDFNMRLARDVVDGPMHNPEALTAAGGLCAPLEVRYDVVDVSTSERPLRAGLPSFRADRGGLTWMPSPVLTDVVVDNTSGAIDTTTVSGDASAGTKTIQEFTCPSSLSRQVVAISERIQFGHFADRYWTENVKAIQNETRARFSRHAEQLLFEQMRTDSVLVNSNTSLNPVGALPSFLGAIMRAARGYRQQFRISETTPLRLVMPTWLVDVLGTDLMYQAPGDGALTDSKNIQALVTSHLSSINVRPIYQRDDARTNDANGAGAFAWSSVQAAGGLADYPGRASVLLFHEGAFLFLDGGTLDFGIIRDSATLAANKWQTFYETFESVAMVGKASWNITIELCASGTRAALASVDCGPIGS